MSEEERDGGVAGGDRLTRRTLLGTAGGSLGVSSLGAPTYASGLGYRTGNGLPQASTGPDEQSAGRFLPYPDDPFIVTQNGHQLLIPPDQSLHGWTPMQSDEETIRTFLGFHSDVLDIAPLAHFEDGEPATYGFHEGGLELSRQTGLPTTAGWNPTLQMGEDAAMAAYGPIMGANAWTYPDGGPVEHPSGLLVRTFDGEPATISFAAEFGIPSPFAPGTLDLMVSAAVGRFEQGFSGFFLDGTNVFHVRGLDYSVWATATFREHLAALPDDRLSDLGIADPSSFDVRQYLRSEDLTLDSDADPRDDPVFREHVLHQHRGVRDLFASFRRRILDGLPNGVAAEDVALWANQFVGSFHTPQAPTIYASDAFDLINTEQTQPFFDYGYKVFHSLGRFEKPVIAETELTAPPGNPNHPLAEYDPRRNYPNLQRFMLGEGYAMGAVHRISLTGRVPADVTLNHWVRKDGSVPEELRSFVDFVWAHERFLADVELDNSVAVVWSLPDRIWRRHGRGMDRFQGGPGTKSFLGTMTLLREAQIPYEVLTFGHPELWDDPEQLERLTTYDAVVLPSLLCLTDAQRDALVAYLDGDGTVVVSGSPPDRTERYDPRDDVEPILDHENAIYLEEDPGRRRQEEDSSNGSLVRTLRDHGVASVTAADDPTVCVNRLLQPDASRLVLHLLNYDYQPETDAFATKRDVTLQVSKPAFSVEAARYYSPRGTTDIETADRGDAVEVVVPELVEWGFVAFGPSSDAFSPAVSARSARETVERAREEVDRAGTTSGDAGLELVVAEVTLRSAETALSYDAYGQAELAARESIEAASTVGQSRQRSSTSTETPGFTILTALFGGATLAAIQWLRRRYG